MDPVSEQFGGPQKTDSGGLVVADGLSARLVAARALRRCKGVQQRGSVLGANFANRRDQPAIAT